MTKFPSIPTLIFAVAVCLIIISIYWLKCKQISRAAAFIICGSILALLCHPTSSRLLMNTGLATIASVFILFLGAREYGPAPEQGMPDWALVMIWSGMILTIVFGVSWFFAT